MGSLLLAVSSLQIRNKKRYPTYTVDVGIVIVFKERGEDL